MSKPPVVSNQIDLANLYHAFDPDAFSELIAANGIRLQHFAAMACPIGKVQEDDLRRPGDHDHGLCSNGFILTDRGYITAVLQYNTLTIQQIDPGRLDSSACQATFGMTYDNTDVTFEPLQYDRFYLADENFTVQTWETATHSLTGNDRLKYPVVKVQDLVDSKGKRYYLNTDFVITNGNIEWVGPGPGMEVSTKAGVVFSVRYDYRPYFVCDNLLHELRISQKLVPEGRQAKTFPKTAILRRETFYHDIQVSDTDSPRETVSAGKGSYGPR